MNAYLEITFANEKLQTRATGVLWWPDARLMCVSDLHLGKAARIARRGGGLLPPYETRDTLDRLATEIHTLHPKTVICLGDSFDDLDAAGDLTDANRERIVSMQAGREWIWIEGNHDPGPVELGGSHLAIYQKGPLIFRHIAAEAKQGGEISGHYHPKAAVRLKGRYISRPCFLKDQARLIMPAFGTYTGGLRSDDPVLNQLMAPDALAILTGRSCHVIAMPRGGS